MRSKKSPSNQDVRACVQVSSPLGRTTQSVELGFPLRAGKTRALSARFVTQAGLRGVMLGPDLSGSPISCPAPNSVLPSDLHDTPRRRVRSRAEIGSRGSHPPILCETSRSADGEVPCK